MERKGGIGRGGEKEKGVNDSWVDSVGYGEFDVDDVDDVFDDVDVFDVVVVVFDDDDDDDDDDAVVVDDDDGDDEKEDQTGIAEFLGN